MLATPLPNSLQTYALLQTGRTWAILTKTINWTQFDATPHNLSIGIRKQQIGVIGIELDLYNVFVCDSCEDHRDFVETCCVMTMERGDKCTHQAQALSNDSDGIRRDD